MSFHSIYKNIEFILASTSPRRIELLKNLNLNFKVVKSLYKEKETNINMLPKKYVETNAYQKCFYVAHQNQNKIVVGCDTIVTINNIILGKPINENNAAEMLQLLSGKTHYVLTSYAILLLNKNIKIKRTIKTEVLFKHLTKEEISWYISTKEPFDKAGAYAIQGIGSFMVKKIKGSYTNVIGLPLVEFLDDLKKIEFN